MNIDLVHILVSAISIGVTYFAMRNSAAPTPDGVTPPPALPLPPGTDPRLALLLQLGQQILKDEDHDGVADIFQRGLLKRLAAKQADPVVVVTPAPAPAAAPK